MKIPNYTSPPWKWDGLTLKGPNGTIIMKASAAFKPEKWNEKIISTAPEILGLLVSIFNRTAEIPGTDSIRMDIISVIKKLE